jgi:hypothetical protein
VGRSGVQGACGAFKAASRRSKFKVQGAFGAFKAAQRGSRPLRGVQSACDAFKVGAARVIGYWLLVIGYLGRFAAFKAPAACSRFKVAASRIQGSRFKVD